MSVKKNDVRCARECTGTRLFVATTYHGQYLTMRHRQIEVKGRGAMPMLSVASSCWFAVCGKNEPRRARRVDKSVCCNVEVISFFLTKLTLTPHSETQSQTSTTSAKIAGRKGDIDNRRIEPYTYMCNHKCSMY